MKKYKILIISIMMILPIVGCSTGSPFKRKADNNVKRLEMVSQVAYGVDYALVKTNVPVAIELNNKVMSLAGPPTVKQMQEIKESIITTNMVPLDNKIIAIQKEERKVDVIIEKEASKVPELEQELNEYKSWFGLGGLFKSIKRISIYLVIFGVIFVILRILSTANPIASGIFSIFESIGGTLLKAIKIIIPKSFDAISSTSQSALNKVVDTIEMSHITNNNDIQKMKDTLSNKMTDQEKQLVKQIKDKLLY